MSNESLVPPTSGDLTLTDFATPEASTPALPLPEPGVAAPPGFVWTATGIGGFVAKNLASGVISSIGGKAFGKFLDSIGMGGPDVGALLEDIGNRLKVVETAVKEIKMLVEQVLHDLHDLRRAMDSSFLEIHLFTPFAAIDDAYGSSDVLLRTEVATNGITPNFTQLLDVPPGKRTPAELEQLKVDARAFAEGVDKKWNLSMQIQAIHNVLGKTVGQGNTLLESWTEGLIVPVREGKLSLEAACSTLESYFQQAVAKQLLAASMQCVAIGDNDERLNSFVQTNLGGKLRIQTHNYLRCIERLVFDSVSLSKVPTTFTPDQSPEFPADMEAIFLRADLICAAINLTGNRYPVKSAKEAIAGVYGRRLALPREVGLAGFSK